MSEAWTPIGYEGRKVQVVERVCDILDLLLGGSKGLTLGHVAEVIEVPRKTVSQYLVVLEARQYIKRDEHGDYGPGPAFGTFVMRRLELLRRMLRPRLEQVRDTLGETVNLGVLDGRGVKYLDIVASSRQPPWQARAGGHDGMHSTALGKAIAAFLPGGQVRDIFGVAGMPRKTSATITEFQPYLDELARVRKRGWAFDDSENEPDGRCIAVSVPDDRMPLAVSVSAPPSRLSRDLGDEIAFMLGGMVHRLVEDLGGQPRQP
jgi:IclR family acetate operon transcriptional repressor